MRVITRSIRDPRDLGGPLGPIGDFWAILKWVMILADTDFEF
jgi:hypothetical protein